MPFVDRDGANSIVAVYERPQFPGQEQIRKTDPELVAYYDAQAAPKPADDIVDERLARDPVIDAIVTEMANIAAITKTAMVDRIKAHVATP